MRRRFEIDSELDRQLVRKLEQRGNGAYQHIGLDEFVACFESMLEASIGSGFEVTNACWFAGGASKIQLGCDLTWTDPVRGRVTDDLVVRMDPAESLNATSRRQEGEVLTAVSGHLPVPRVLWLDEEARWFLQPALVYTRMAGVAKPELTDSGAVSGLGTNFGPDLRRPLGEQFVSHLAALHTLEVGSLELPSFDKPAVDTVDAPRWKLNQYRRVWEEDRSEDFRLVDAAASWLGRNLPTVDRVSLLHGDYRSGNFLFDEQDARITAWLDWEYTHLGDRHRDLAWVTDATFGHTDPETGMYLVSGLFTEEDFLARYEEASGLPVDRNRLHYYKVANTHQLLVATLATATRISFLGKTHQNVLLAWVRGMTPVLSQQLLRLLTVEE
ncbi:phosphotransferase family protein [Nocardiopsis oceani]